MLKFPNRRGNRRETWLKKSGYNTTDENIEQLNNTRNAKEYTGRNLVIKATEIIILVRRTTGII